MIKKVNKKIEKVNFIKKVDLYQKVDQIRPFLIKIEQFLIKIDLTPWILVRITQVQTKICDNIRSHYVCCDLNGSH